MSKSELSENPLQDWINSDKELSAILVEIQSMDIPVEEQAELAFHRVADAFNLPKMPEDIQYPEKQADEDLQPTSVYEQLGYHKFLYPDDDPRAQVLAALYMVKFDFRNFVGDVLQKQFGSKIPPYVGIGHRGEYSKVEIVFISENESWVDMGCKLFSRPI